MRGEMFGGKIMLTFAGRTVNNRDLILFCPSPQTTAKAPCHSHQMIVVQVFVGTVQCAPPDAKASAKLTSPEVSIQNHAIDAIITTFEKIAVQSAQLVRHALESVTVLCGHGNPWLKAAPTGAIFSEHRLRKNVATFRCKIECPSQRQTE
jgi:hypothetical protein